MSAVDCGTLPDTEQLPLLDVASSIDDAGKVLTIAVVNRSATERIDVQLEVQGSKTRGEWTVHELNAPSVNAANTLQNPERNVVSHVTKSLPENTSRHALAAHGIAIFQVSLSN